VPVKLHTHLIQLAPETEYPLPFENPPSADAMVAPDDAEVTATIEAQDAKGYQQPLLENMGPYDQAAMLTRQAVLAVLNPENPAAENPIVDPLNPPVVFDATSTPQRATRLYQEVADSPPRYVEPVVKVHNRAWHDMPHATLQQLNGFIPLCGMGHENSDWRGVA
jgi:hypothetical protein